MRGFRPSYFHDPSEDMLELEEHEKDREENVQRYIIRVRNGLPVFDDEPSRSPAMGQIIPLWTMFPE